MSERKEELAARMRLVKAALDSEPVAVAILRAPELRYLYANTEMRRLVGRDLTGMMHTDAWPVGILERITAALRRVAATGEAWIERDTPWDLPRTPGGRSEHMYLTLEVTRVELGESVYLLLTITETTDEVVMRQQRDVMAERMAEVLESVSDAVFALDDEWRITYANGHMAELCHARADDLIGVELWGVLPEARGTEFERACREAHDSHERVRLESEGGPFGASFTARIYPAENGLVVYVTDTSERTRARKALDKALQRFARVLDLTTDGFYILDRSWRFVHVNRAIAEAVGRSQAELVGAHASTVVPFEPDTKVVREFTRSIQTGEPVSFTAEHEATGLWYEFRALPIDDELAVFVRDITEQLSAQSRIERQARYSGALNAIDADINSTLDFDTIMSRMIVGAARATDSEFAIVAMLDAEGWVVTHSHGVDRDVEGQYFAYSELPHATAALESGSTVVIDDPRHDPRVNAEIAEALGLSSMLVIPLRRGDEVFGAILLNRASPPRPFTPEEVEFGTQLGYHVSLAVENAWLLERERESTHRAAQDAETANLLLTAAESLSASLSVDDVTSSLRRLVARATGRSRVTILRRDVIHEETDVLSTSCPAGDREAHRFLIVLYGSALAEVFEASRPVTVDYATDEAGDIPDAVRAAADRCNVHRVLFVPIRRGPDMIGALAVDEPGSGEPFTDREIDSVMGLAAEAAPAIENAHLYESSQEAARYSEALNEIDVDINSSLDFQTVMRRTLEHAAEILTADAAQVGMLEPDGTWLITQAYGDAANTAGDHLPAEAVPHARLAVHSREAVVVDDCSTDPRVRRDLMAQAGVCSTLAVPLLRGDHPMGVLFFNRHRKARRFTSIQVDFARKLAAHVSLAVHNSRLYREQREIADTLQEALLVMPEHVDGLEFAHLYRSAAEAARVGGDFYDIFTIDDHTAGIVIGDVSGKGLDAAVMTSLARNTIRAYSAERMAPSSVLDRAGDIVLASSERWVFMSVFYGVVDFENGLMSYCNAGHPAPVVLGTDGSLRTLDPTAPIAGAFKGAVFSQAHVPLHPGDTIVLYTDGLTEARSNGDMYGEERLHAVLAACQGLPPDKIVSRVIDDAERFARALNDDVAVLAVRITGGD